MPDTDPTNLLLFFGRMHPLVVHLPIGFLALLAVLEVVRWFKRFRGAGEARAVVLALTAVSSVAAVICGLMLAEGGDYDARLLFWHQWLGIGLAGGCVATALAFWGKKRWLYAGFLIATLALLVPSTHFGGSMTHGSEYLIAYAPQWVRQLADKPSRTPATKPTVVTIAATTSSPPANPQQAVVFTTVVQPVFAKYCVACHGAEKTKGELRLDSFDAIAKGGESGAVIVAGKSKESPMIERLLLPIDDDDHMPPDGKPQPSAEQVALLKWWVDAGASRDKTVEQLDPPVAVSDLIAAALGAAPATRPTEPAPLDSLAGEIARLTSQLNIVIEPVAMEQPWLAINASTAKPFGDEQLAQLKPLALNVTVLNLAGTDVTDQGLATLAAMPNLQRLRLERTKVTDAGTRHLGKLAKLEYLNLYGTEITDAGLKPLQGLPVLRQVYLWRTKVDPAAAKAFADAMIDQAKIEQWRQQIALLQAQIKSETVEVFQGVAPSTAPTQPAPGAAPPAATAAAAAAAADAVPVAVNTLCPVSGKAIDATKFLDFEGKRVAFCCDNCPKEFQKDPAKYKDKLK